MDALIEYHARHCAGCGAEAPLDSEGHCDYCGIESSEAEHEANNTLLDADLARPAADGA